MSKAVEGAALLAGAVGMGVAAFMNPALIASPAFDKIMASLAIGGISMEAGAIATALTSNRGMAITTRQAAANRQIIYGQQRVGGVMIYNSTTGSSHDQWNAVIVIAGHECESIQNLYLDGRQVHWLGSGDGYSVRNGVGFGGVADNNTYTGPDGLQYNFGGTGHSGIYCEARYGDQLEGDVIAGLTGNDPNWAASGANSPWLGGCCYVYLKIEYNPTVFPNMPEIRFTVNGKNNIWDPRTQTYGFTNNWALIAADIITDPVYGLGDNTVNQLNLIAAANVCDEQIEVEALGAGQTESRYTCNYHYDTSVSPGDALAAIMPGANGGISQIGGQWYVWPDYYQGPSFTFGEQHLTNTFNWKPYRSVRDLINRVNGTYIAPTFPWNVGGNLYDANGFYNGQAQNNFPFAWQPTNFPQYAADTLHGFPSDEYLAEDGGNQHPLELSLNSVISVTQAQRIAKLNLMHNRQQGEGTLEMGLASYVMQPKDTFYFNFAPLGWTNQLLEVTSVSLRVDEDEDSGAQSVRVQYGVRQTDPSVYEWTPASEELTVYDVPASPSQVPLTPAPPTDVTLTSGPSVAQVNPDGTVNNIIEVQWNTPQDTSVVQLQIQYQLVGASTWLSAPAADISLNYQWISNVVPGSAYNVQIRSARANGVCSGWVQVLNYTVEATPTYLGTLGAQLPSITANSQLAGTVPGEMVSNGNFAAGLTGWTDGTISTAEFKNSTQSLSLINDTSNQLVNGFLAGHTYLLSFWVMTNGSVITTNGLGAGAYMNCSAGGITVLDANSPNLHFGTNGSAGPIDVEVAATTAIGWEQVQMVFTTSANCYINLYLQNSLGGGVVTGTAWFSNVSITDVTTQSQQLGGVVASLITPIVNLMPAQAGADVTAQQPIVYTGSSSNIIPNGTFILGNAEGYELNAAAYQANNPPNIVLDGGGGSVFTPSFSVQPGQIYRLQYVGGVQADGTREFYQRIFWGSQYAPNIHDGGSVAGYMGYYDFIASGNMTDAPTTYTYEWTCPAGASYASLAVYSLGTAAPYFQQFVAIDYGATAQWGADQTSQNTANNTENVGPVPASTIAQMLPTGYELFIDSGARTYEIEAI